MSEQTENPRRYVTPKDPPRKGDTIILHGKNRIVASVQRGKVTLEPRGSEPPSWYWITSLELVKAYYP